MQIDYITKLLGIQWFCASKLEIENRDGRKAVVIYLDRVSENFICSRCGQVVSCAIPYREREVQHLTVWGYLTFLRFEQYRVLCPTCGLVVEYLPFVDKYSRVTKLLAYLVAELCKVMTNKAVATFQFLHRETVKMIDKRAIQQAQASRDLEGITTLGVDEIAVGKGHNYWHLVSSLEGPYGNEVIYVGEGRREKDLKKFWQWFGKERAKDIL